MKKLALALAAATLLAGCGRSDLSPTAGTAGIRADLTARQVQKYSTLQRHVLFFDRDGDRLVTLSETRQGLEDLGLSSLLSPAAALAINGGLGPKTSGHLTTVITVDHMDLGMHKSDTGNLDEHGNFQPENFQHMFATFDTNHSASLSKSEIAAMIGANKEDLVGHQGAKGEFGLLLKLASDTTETVDGKQEPALSRSRLQAFYDGTLFYAMASEKGHPHTQPK